MPYLSMKVQVTAGSHLLHLSLLQYNIHSYPTTVIFNKSSIHEYEGHHSADGILEFIEVRDRLQSHFILPFIIHTHICLDEIDCVYCRTL